MSDALQDALIRIGIAFACGMIIGGLLRVMGVW